LVILGGDVDTNEIAYGALMADTSGPQVTMPVQRSEKPEVTQVA